MHLNSHLNINGETILIIGNRSYRNMGDELILLGTIQLLLKQQKTIIISCYDPKWLKHFFSQFIDVAAITFIHELPKGLKSAFKWLKKGGLKELKYFWTTDTVILGGGEIITEENPSAYRYRLVGMRPFLLRIPPLFLRTTSPDLYIMGGIQIPKSPFKQRLLRFLLNRTTHLYLRDFQALEEVKKFGYEDVDFFMDTSYFACDWADDVAPLHSLHKDMPPYIVVNLNKNGERFLSELMQDVQTYLNKGYMVYFVPVAKGHNTYYNDEQYFTLLRKGVNSEATGKDEQSFQLLDREYDFQTFLHILKGAELVISTRLHLFLIASFLNVPTKVYPYQRKILKMQEVMKKFAKKD